MKVKILLDYKVVFCCSVFMIFFGKLFCEVIEFKFYLIVKIYDLFMVWYWDIWFMKNWLFLWYGLLERKDENWKLGEFGFINLLVDICLSFFVLFFGGIGDFDLLSKGIVFVVKDLEFNEVWFIKIDLYYVFFRDFGEKFDILL